MQRWSWIIQYPMSVCHTHFSKMTLLIEKFLLIVLAFFSFDCGKLPSSIGLFNAAFSSFLFPFSIYLPPISSSYNVYGFCLLETQSQWTRPNTRESSIYIFIIHFRLLTNISVVVGRPHFILNFWPGKQKCGYICFYTVLLNFSSLSNNWLFLGKNICSIWNLIIFSNIIWLSSFSHPGFCRSQV